MIARAIRKDGKPLETICVLVPFSFVTQKSLFSCNEQGNDLQKSNSPTSTQLVNTIFYLNQILYVTTKSMVVIGGDLRWFGTVEVP